MAWNTTNTNLLKIRHGQEDSVLALWVLTLKFASNCICYGGILDVFQILRFNVMSTSYLLAIFVLAILLCLKICARIEKVPVHPGAGSAPKAPFTQVVQNPLQVFYNKTPCTWVSALVQRPADRWQPSNFPSGFSGFRPDFPSGFSVFCPYFPSGVLVQNP